MENVWQVLLLLGILLQLAVVMPDCSLKTVANKDSVITLSNEPVNADTAERECVKLGGHLATPKDNQTKTMLKKEFTKRYDTQRIYIFYDKTNKFYKFSKITNETGPWKTSNENLTYIDLYKQSDTGRVKVTFCRAYRFSTPYKWLVAVSQTGTYCGPRSSGWSFDFYLYGAASINGSQTIYSYRSPTKYGSRLTSVKGNIENNYRDDRIQFYAPTNTTANVLIGARYSNSRWLWSDGTPANFAAPTTSPSTCLQKAYNVKSTQFIDVQCTSSAFYACQVKFLATISKETCKPSNLVIQWDNNMSKLAAITMQTITVKIQYTGGQQKSFPYSNLTTTLTGFLVKKDYQFTIQAQLRGCKSLNIISKVNITTGYGIPDAARSYISSKSKCTVVIPGDTQYLNKQKVMQYKVTLQSAVNQTVQHYDVTTESPSHKIEFQIPTKHYGRGQNVNISIQAITSTCSSTVTNLSGTCISPECPLSTITTKDRIIILSDKIVNVDSAESTCAKMGGTLAINKDATVRKALETALKAEYLPDLKQVWIYQLTSDPTTFRYSFNPSLSGDWKPYQTIPYILLFKYFVPKSKPIHFCKRNNTIWKISTNSLCSEAGWTWDFTLYGGNKQQDGFKTYFINNGLQLTNNGNSMEAVYALDINVFIGVKFDAKKQKWIWSDGTEANYTIQKSSTCQQKALNYEGGWKLVDKPCTNFKAHYACQVQLKIKPVVDQCNSTVLSVKIPNNFTELGYFTGQTSKPMIITKGPNKSTSGVNHYFETYTELTKRTTYKITAKATFSGCIVGTIETSANVTTAFGIPDTVTDAKINSTQPCIIQVSRPPTDYIYYDITATGDSITTNQTYNTSNTFPLTFLTNGHRGGDKLNLTIQAISCEGKSSVTALQGFCLAKKETQSKSEGPPTAIILGVIGGLLALVLLVLLIIALLRRTKHPKEKQPSTLGPTYENQQNLYDDTACVEPENPYENAGNVQQNNTNSKLKEQYLCKMDNDMDIFHSEFQKIVNESKTTTNTRKHSQKSINSSKNRYKNIYPYDHARVILAGRDEHNDYINASFIPGFGNTAKFIASQGPRPNTIDDFWLMVWQQNVSIIVMLTNFIEKGKKKCEQYWPNVGQTRNSDGVMIKTMEEVKIGGITKRKFHLDNGEQTRDIEQFQYTTWPDHGIPVTTSNMIYLRKMVEENYNNATPMVVHCSAGVGRTGTYIAMDILFSELDKRGEVDVQQTIKDMRNNRTDMVQTMAQYVYIHKLLVEHEMIPDTERTTNNIQEMTEADLSNLCSEEFHLLTQLLQQGQEIYNEFQVSVEKNGSWEKTSASFIQDLGCSVHFIASPSPNKNTQEKFWKVVAEQNVDIVVSLEKKTSDLVANTKQHKSLNLGSMQLNVSQIINNQDITEKTITTQLVGATSTTEAKHLQMENWSQVSSPPSAKTMLELIEKVQQLQREGLRGKVLVCCSDGCTRSGTFIALVNILELLKAQNRVDVLRMVKDLRDMRPNMVDDLNCYKYIYSVILEYLASFDTYANYR